MYTRRFSACHTTPHTHSTKHTETHNTTQHHTQHLLENEGKRETVRWLGLSIAPAGIKRAQHFFERFEFLLIPITRNMNGDGQRVYRFQLLPAVSSNSPHVDVTQHVKQPTSRHRTTSLPYCLFVSCFLLL